MLEMEEEYDVRLKFTAVVADPAVSMDAIQKQPDLRRTETLK